NTSSSILELNGDIDLSSSGLTIIGIENNSFNFTTLDQGGAYLSISDLYLNYNNSMILSSDSIEIDAYGELLLEVSFVQSSNLMVILNSSGYVTVENMYVKFDGITINLGSFSFNGSFTAQAGIYIGENSIAIGGELYMDVNVDFNINGTDGSLSGIFEFSSPDDTVYINWTLDENGTITNFSIEGTGYFSISNFSFCFGSYIDLYIEKVIGSFELTNSGREGSISLLINDSLVDVDIYVNLANLGNITLEGNLSIDIEGSANGTVWVSWNLAGNDTNISFGGDLFGYGTINASIEDLLFSSDNISISADEISIEGIGGVIVTNEYLLAGAYLDHLTIDDLSINASSSTFELNGDLDLSSSGLTVIGIENNSFNFTTLDQGGAYL
ncbi:MAG: hypothetical protein J7J22_00940, partial [Candidatus Verstraetearchaeota archaeon]|nr:hypothetical protein [Candidatus Verstraetearchaeota archaeon]